MREELVGERARALEFDDVSRFRGQRDWYATILPRPLLDEMSWMTSPIEAVEVRDEVGPGDEPVIRRREVDDGEIDTVESGRIHSIHRVSQRLAFPRAPPNFVRVMLDEPIGLDDRAELLDTNEDRPEVVVLRRAVRRTAFEAATPSPSIDSAIS